MDKETEFYQELRNSGTQELRNSGKKRTWQAYAKGALTAFP
jgi:hypothetical protein